MGRSVARKRLEQLQQEHRFLHAFKRYSDEAKAKDKARRNRRLTAEEAIERVDCGYYQHRFIRDPRDWKSPSYNIEKQLRDFINHVFVEYEAPTFLFDLFMADQKRPNHIPHETFEEVSSFNDEFREWFLIVAQGGSFRKRVKGILNKKEASLFLQAPTDKMVHENIWWAKCKALGMADWYVEYLITRILSKHFIDDPDERMHELVHFYNKIESDVEKAALYEITDYISWQLENEPTWRLKGRTLSSIIKLSNDWHMMVHKAKVKTLINLPNMGLKNWTHHEGFQKWQIRQLTTNIELSREGNKQRHCVYSYVSACQTGRSYIFTMDSEDDMGGQRKKHITIEVDSDKKIVQARGKMNRRPDEDEMAIMKKWASAHNLEVDKWVGRY